MRASQSVTVLVNLGPDLNCIIDHQLLMPFIKHQPRNKKKLINNARKHEAQHRRMVDFERPSVVFS